MQEGSNLWTCDPVVLEVEAAAEATEGMCGCCVEDRCQKVMEVIWAGWKGDAC